ncbi:MAG: protein translocase subunit SecF [Rickettsiales bacterium]|nr:protein translocase subunit SecF [Rickettsiales bacterium]
MAMLPITLIPQTTSINFIKTRFIGFSISMLLMVAAAVIIWEKGLNLGIDFAGGILIDIRAEQATDLAPLRAALNDPAFGEVSLQHFGSDDEVLVRIEVSDETEQAELVEKAKQIIGQTYENVEFRQIDYVGPTVGRELIESGIMALCISMAAMMLYIWFRFEWQFGVGGILALLHDLALMIAFYAFTRFDFSLTSIAAILTVIGYSINDSVVIYDRIRENMRKYKKMPLDELLNKSINDTLSRTIVTGLTTIIAAAALVIFGGEVIRGFSYALLFGVVVGTYSSIYISAPILLYFGIREEAEDPDD